MKLFINNQKIMDEIAKDKSRLIKSITALMWVLGLVAVATFFVLLNVNKSVDSAERKTITVQGKAERYVTPDIAMITFGVSEEGKKVADAQKLATDKINKAIAFLKDSGIDEKDIKNIGYNVNPKYEYYYENNGIRCLYDYCQPPYVYKNEIVGYQVDQQVQVKLRDLEKAGDIVSGLGSFGVGNLSGLSFEVEKLDKIEEEVKNEAIKDARAKAKERAKSLGVRLGDVLSVSDDGYYPIYYGKGYAEATMAVADGRGGGIEGVTVPIAPDVPAGQNQIVSTVTITYEIK